MSDDLRQIVLDSLDSEDPNILRAACIMSGMLGYGQAERGLIKALGHKAWQIQAEAAQALGRLASKGAVPYLRRLLKASDADIRQKVLAAAAKAGESGDEEDTHPEVKRAAAIAISAIEPAVAQEALLAALASGQPNLLGAAMSGLANLEVSKAWEQIAQLTSHDEKAIRAASAACLGKMRASEAVPRLTEMLDDDDASVRKEALIALNHIKDRAALGGMAACLEDSDSEVRRVAAIALGNTRQRVGDVVNPLIRALDDHEAKVRLAALKALANLRAASALEKAAALLADTHEDVCKQAGATVTVLAQARLRPEYEADNAC